MCLFACMHACICMYLYACISKSLIVCNKLAIVAHYGPFKKKKKKKKKKSKDRKKKKKKKSSILILGYLGVRDSFLTTILKNNHDINIKSNMAALNLHTRERSCGILCKSCSYNGIIIIIIFYVFWNDSNNFW